MPVRQNFDVSHPGWLADAASESRDPSVSAVDWDRVPASYENEAGVKVLRSGTVISRVAGGLAVPRAAAVASITALSESGGTATATAAGHGFVVGDMVTISGTTNYNGTHEITDVPTANTFEFEIAGSPADEDDGPYPGTIPAHGILIGPAIEDDRDHAIGGYGVIVGGIVFQNLLADAEDDALEDYLAELDAAGPGFRFTTYADDRVPDDE